MFGVYLARRKTLVRGRTPMRARLPVAAPRTLPAWSPTDRALVIGTRRPMVRENLPNYLGWRRALEAWGDQLAPPNWINGAIGNGPYQQLTL